MQISLANSNCLSHEITFPFFHEKVSLKKSSVLVTTVALTVIGSMALTYFTSRNLILTGLAISVTSICMLPKLLVEVENPFIIRLAMITSFVAFGSLSLGGITSVSIQLADQLIVFTKAADLRNVLALLCRLSLIMGYGALFSVAILKQSYELIKDSQIEKRIKDLKNQLNLLVTNREQNLTKSFGSYMASLLAMTFPHLIPSCPFLFPMPGVVKTAAVFYENLFQEFSEFVEVMIHPNVISSFFREAGDADIEQRRLVALNFIKFSLLGLEGEELKKSIEFLSKHIDTIVPAIFDENEFTSCFKDPHVKQLFIAQMNMDLFVQDLKEFTREGEIKFREIVNSFKHLKQQIPEKERDSNEEWNQTCERYGALNEQVSTITYGLKGGKTLVEHMPSLVDKEVFSAWQTSIQDFRVLSDEIRDFNPYEQSTIFYDLGPWFTTTPDYKELALWLNLPLPLDENRISLALEMIGLRSIDDLKQKEIIPQKKNEKNEIVMEGISTKTLKQNLKTYIENHPNFKKRDLKQIESKDAKPIDAKDIPLEQGGTQTIYSQVTLLLNQAQPILYRLSQKISKIAYKILTKAFILIPLYLNPQSAVNGFMTGCILVVVKRLTNSQFDPIGDILKAFKQSLFFPYLSERRLFSPGPRIEARSDTFARSNLLIKLQMLSSDLLLTMFMDQAHLAHFEGAMIGREMGNLI